MKKNDHSLPPDDPLEWTVLRLIHTVLNSAKRLRLVGGGQQRGTLRHGYHCHEAWEMFCPLEGDLVFETAYAPPATYEQGTLVIVPPKCLHMTIDRLPQSKELRIVTMNLPGDQAPYGTLRVGGVGMDARSALSADELSRWQELLGGSPREIMGRVAAAIGHGNWGEERAVAWLRLLFSSYADIVSDDQRHNRKRGRRCVTEALALLQTHYFDPHMSVASVAAKVGLSESHLSSLFRRTTGRTIHQMLIEIRMRRASELLTRTNHSIKEIAALTGWSNQLYFSAAYRRFYGVPPSEARQQAQT